jgi:hypothetical protein
MNFKKTIIAASIALTAGFASADSFDFVIPAAGTGAGANNSQWQSEITIHNAGQELLLLKLSYHDATGALRSLDLPMPGRTTKTLPDTVKNDFGQTQSTGAIVVDTDDVLRNKLSITSRTFNLSPAGEFGQDIPALTAAQSIAFGDTGMLNGPANAAANRFNFGIFASEETTIEWRLVRRDGTIARSIVKTYKGSTQTQHSAGVTTLFGDTPQDNDVIHANVRSGHAWIYGSIVNNQSGDPTYVPGGRTRENMLPEVLGVDIERDGVIDFRDANQDGVLDEALDLATANFPNVFQVVAKDPERKDLTFTIVGTGTSAQNYDGIGTIIWSPSVGLKGTSGALVVRISDGVDSVDFRIPVNYR